MPSAGDSTNLGPNLRTLAQLRNKPGAKLSYDTNRGRFSIQEAGIRQSLARTLSSNSVKNEEYFGRPIRELFAAAHTELDGEDVDVTDALEGLRALRNSYRGEEEKLEVLDAVIEDAELGMRKDPVDVIRLRMRYQYYLSFGLAQCMFLPVSNPGVCYSFAVHWARRILLGKTYWGVTNTEDIGTPLTLDAQQKARMMRKVDGKIRPLQDGITRCNRKRGIAVMTLATEKKFKRYGNLFIFSLMEEEEIERTARGTDIVQAALGVTEKRGNEKYSIFLLNFYKISESDRGGHTVGIHLEGGMHFFDPNFGEFMFPRGSERDWDRFLNDWWSAFYTHRGVPEYTHWGLDGVLLREGEPREDL
jgi:hypothetical protein